METKKMKIGLVIMASGLGKRFGANKLMIPLESKPLIRWILDVTEGLFDARVVVTRSREVQNLCEDLDIPCIFHELPYRNDTVRLGLTALKETVEYCFFAPGDQPLLQRETVVRLLRAAESKQDKIVRTAYEDRVGSPMGFPKAHFEKLLCLPEGKGGNYVANQYAASIEKVFVKAAYELLDVDTREDLEKVQMILEKS